MPDPGAHLHPREGSRDSDAGPLLRPVPADATLIYIHIGKTAGMTLHQVLERQFPKDRIFSFHEIPRERVVAAASADTPAEHAPPTLVGDRPVREHTLAYFAGLPEEARRRFRLVEGHTIYGIHEFVPRPSVYATFLREPVARVVSGYGYIQRRTHHPLFEVSRRLDLLELVESGLALQFDNGQTRALAGDLGTPFGGCTSDMLERAKRNVERDFAAVGITERFDESLLLLRAAFGWSRLFYVRTNTSPRRPDDLPTATRRTIERYNELDRDLYSWALRRFEEAVAEDPSFGESLRRFRAGNERYRPVGRLRYTLPRRVRDLVRQGRLGR